MTDWRKRKNSRAWALAAVLASAGLAMLVAAAIGYATYEPCVSDEFLGCLFDGPGFRAAAFAIQGLWIGPIGGFVLWVLWGWHANRPRSFTSRR